MLAFVAGCKPEDSPNNGGGNNGNNDSDVRVTTYTPQDITATTAKCGGDVIATQGLSLTELGVCWGVEQSPTADQKHLSTTVWNEPFVCTITDLEPKTKYYVRSYALRGLVFYYGEEKNFTTLEVGMPMATTTDVFGVTAVSAIIKGEVISDGGFVLTERGFCWSISQEPTISDSHIEVGSGLGFFTSEIIGLEPNTTYYVRAYAKNECGVSYGAEKSFTTLSDYLTIEAISAEGWLFDGQVINLNEVYSYGFRAVSDAGPQVELARLLVVCEDFVLYDSIISGTDFIYTGEIYFSNEGIRDIIDSTEIVAIVTNSLGTSSTASIKVYINEPKARGFSRVPSFAIQFIRINQASIDFGESSSILLA